MSAIFSAKDDVSVAAALVAAYNQLHDAVVQQGASGVSNFAPSGGLFHRDVTSVQGPGINFQNQDFQNPLVVQSVPMTVNPVGATGFTGSYNIAIDLRGKLHAHFLDDGSHMCKDIVDDYYVPKTATGVATGIMSLPLPSSQKDVAGVSQLLNGIQSFFNSHLTQSVPSGIAAPGLFQVHPLNDTVNSNSTTIGSSTGTNSTLAASLASGVSAHLLTGPSVGRVYLKG